MGRLFVFCHSLFESRIFARRCDEFGQKQTPLIVA